MIPSIASGWDIVLLARKPILKANFQDIEVALNNLLSQANLLENPQ
jgi:RNase P protein component